MLDWGAPAEDAKYGTGFMRASANLGLASLVAGVFLLAASLSAPASAARNCGPGAIGLQREVEVDAKGGPRYGHNHSPGRDILQPGEVVLTFDDGPHKMYTQPILDALDRHCTKATFFMVGQRILTYPDIAKEVIRRGHTAGTHTWTHKDLAKIETADAIDEVELAISALQKVAGSSAAPFFRFPYLSSPKSVAAHLKSRNTAIFSIDVDSADFRTRSSTKVINTVLRQLEANGRGIILFHDIQPSTAGAIDKLLTEMHAKGYKVVHLVPKQSQTTVASFDSRIGKSFVGKKYAALQVPVSQRGFVSPAWEVRVEAAPRPRNDAYSPGWVSSYPPGGPPQPLPPPQPKPRRTDNGDWLGSIFRGW